ncbi:MAG: SNF2-related protein [Gemmatimonadaceae bacterium]
MIATTVCATPSASRLGDLELFPHQRTGVARIESIIARHGGALLADDVGMGKTFTALAVAHESDRLLVVAPAALKDMWERAIVRCQRTGTVVSFERLSAGYTPEVTPDLVIVDEAHHARNPRTRRYRTLATVARRARVLLLTATPLHNRERDLRHVLALFLGAHAQHAAEAELAACIVRRRNDPLVQSGALPDVGQTRWLPLPHRDDVAELLARIPAPVAPSDGGDADALIALLLLRLWASSDAALRQALRRLWSRATALTSALQSGHFPRRRDLGAWTLRDDALQLAFAPLVTAAAPDVPRRPLLDRLSAHTDAVARALAAIGHGPDVDAARVAHVKALAGREPGGVVAFTQYAETARMLYRRLDEKRGVVLLTAGGATCVSGRLSRRDVLAAVDPGTPASRDPRLPVRLLVTTDLLSEGVNLARLSHAVHLDLPWTPARLAQRVGRLRRTGSPHQHVTVSAFELPAEAERIAGLIRTLQRKASITRRWIESDTFTGFVGVPDTDPTAAPAQLEEEAALQRALARWASDRQSITGNGQCLTEPSWGATTDGVQPPVPTPIAFVTGDVPDWAALLLIRLDGELRLLAVSPDGASDAVPQVLQFLHLFERATDAPPQPLDRVARVVDAWLNRRSAREAVRAANSDAHRRAFRLLARLESALPRRARLQASEDLTTMRQRIAAVRGVGAEKVLADAVGAAALDPDPERALHLLAAGVEGVGSVSSEGRPCVLAGLIALRRID